MDKKVLLTVFSLLIIFAVYTFWGPFNNKFFPHHRKSGEKTTDFEVVFDQSNEQVYSPYDTGFSGMSEFAAMIKQKGGAVSINSQPLNVFLPGFVGEKRVLVLGVSMYRRYSTQDLLAIDAFLVGGGSVLLLVEHDNLMENGTFQNQILKAHGISALPTAALSENKHFMDPPWPYCAVPQWGLTKVQLYFAAPLLISPESKAEPFMKVIAPEDKKLGVVAAVDRSEKGVLFALGDAESVWNGADFLGINAADNMRFIENVLALLIGSETPMKDKSVDKTIHRYSPDKTQKTILFETTGLSIGPKGGLGEFNRFSNRLNERGFTIHRGGGDSTDYTEYDLVVVANPLRKLESPTKILKAKKILLIADGQSDFFNAEGLKEIKELLEKISKSSIKDRAYPLNELSEALGFHFASTTIAISNDQSPKNRPHFFVEAQWMGGEKWTLRRSAAIEPVFEVFPDSLQVLARSQPGSWTSNNLTPVQTECGPPALPFQKPVDINADMGLPIVVSSEKVFAVADIELFTDGFADSKEAEILFQKIYQWLEL